ncbi:MAG: hypothetical protein DRI94_13495 [Bacteroidetes bacterium]|nr:MAG: hypothetical protein DRI94_13495 [Bacteroidota bacterium]
MKIKVGDKVKFLNEVGGGIVTDIIDNQTVKVLNDTGFEIPILTEELMPDYSDIKFQSTTEKTEVQSKINPLEEEPIYTDTEEVNIYLAFVPENQNKLIDSDSDVYLINDSNYFLYYNYAFKGSKKYKGITGTLEPNVKEKIHSLEINMLPDNTEIILQVIFFDKKEFDILKPIHKEINFRTVKFFKQGTYKENDFFDEFALILPVYESNLMQQVTENLKNKDLKKIINQKEDQNNKLNKPKEFIKKEPKLIKEVDLHIHELIDDETGMSDFGKLQFQLDVFHKEMASAIKEGYKRIVFIHGVGTGSLKLKIRNELQHKYKQYQFQDASFKEYGYGATMVLLRR